jgi:hypothetical protein
MERFEHFFESDFLQPGKPLGAIFYAFIFFVVAFYVTRMTRIFFQKLIQREGVYDRTVLQFLSQLVKVCIYLLALVFYVHLIPQLDHLGTALLASVSIVSVVIGFAAQPTLRTAYSGLYPASHGRQPQYHRPKQRDGRPGRDQSNRQNRADTEMTGRAIYSDCRSNWKFSTSRRGRLSISCTHLI